MSRFGLNLNRNREWQFVIAEQLKKEAGHVCLCTRVDSTQLIEESKRKKNQQTPKKPILCTLAARGNQHSMIDETSHLHPLHIHIIMIRIHGEFVFLQCGPHGLPFRGRMDDLPVVF